LLKIIDDLKDEGKFEWDLKSMKYLVPRMIDDIFKEEFIDYYMINKPMTFNFHQARKPIGKMVLHLFSRLISDRSKE
jgi:hypothetical protein